MLTWVYRRKEIANSFNIKELRSVGIIGLGLLGGSLGLALQRAFPGLRRLGYSHRPVTRRKALAAGVVDEVCDRLGETLAGAQLVVLASPLGTFPEILRDLAPFLSAGTLVTDVGSTKVLPDRWARQYLPRSVCFIGSHPIAGSEQRGVEFSRADLFDFANCIITPTRSAKAKDVTLLTTFWEKLGMQVSRMSPAEHDKLLARISHLPHVLATALVNSVDPKETLFCGRGFLDTTRIASGPSDVWRDILMTNADPVDRSISRLIKELTRMQTALREGKDERIQKLLGQARERRNALVRKKLQRKELPV